MHNHINISVEGSGAGHSSFSPFIGEIGHTHSTCTGGITATIFSLRTKKGGLFSSHEQEKQIGIIARQAKRRSSRRDGM
jgi:hypothetical protein